MISILLRAFAFVCFIAAAFGVSEIHGIILLALGLALWVLSTLFGGAIIANGTIKAVPILLALGLLNDCTTTDQAQVNTLLSSPEGKVLVGAATGAASAVASGKTSESSIATAAMAGAVGALANPNVVSAVSASTTTGS